MYLPSEKHGREIKLDVIYYIVLAVLLLNSLLSLSQKRWHKSIIDQ